VRSARALALAAFCGLLSGCASLTSDERAPRTDPVARLTVTGPSPWREDFGDPELRRLVDLADARALDVKMVLARLERAKAEVEAADAPRSPHLEAGLLGAIGDATFRTSRTAATPTLEATYEIDLWGRLASARTAARSDRDAAAFDVAAARVLTGAETTRAYLALRAAQQQQAADFERRGDAERALVLTTTQAAFGRATRRDCAAREIAVQAAIDLALHAREEAGAQAARLADLTGQTAYMPPDSARSQSGAAPASVSSALVDQRPEVQAAFARLQAADQNRAAAVRAARPAFQIAAGLGSPDAAIATLLDVKSLAWAAAASLTKAVIDGGAARARVHGASADADLADLAYRQAVMSAWADLRAASVAWDRAQRELSSAEAKSVAARAAMAAGQARHDAGVIDGIALIDLRDAARDGDDAVRLAQLNLDEARVRRALAAGGR